MWMLGAVVAGLAVAVLVVLVAPVRVELDVDSGRRDHPVQLALRWLRWTWRPGASRRPAAPVPRPEPVRGAPAAASRRRGAMRWWAAVRTPGFVPRCLRLLADLLRLLLPVAVRIRIRAGLDDPAATGTLFGVAHAIGAAPGMERWDLQVEPDFSGPVLSGSARVAWVARPGALLWPLCAFLAAPVVWRAARAAWRA